MTDHHLGAREEGGKPIPAQPKYAVGTVVAATDRQHRYFTGAVLGIEANWYSWTNSNDPPLIIYTLRHPSYAGRRFYTTDERIIGVAP
jgi:hypothetical protein